VSWRGPDLLVALGCLLILAALQPSRPRRLFCPRFWCLGRLVQRDGAIHCTRCEYTRPQLPTDAGRT
jgi:hypothetical protein